MPKGIETTVDGATALVRVLDRDLIAKTVAELLKHADDPAEVQAVTGGTGRKFRVPTRVAKAAGYVDTVSTTDDDAPDLHHIGDKLHADDEGDQGVGGDADADPELGPTGSDNNPDAPVEPRGNANRAAWAQFLTSKGIKFPADPEAEGGSRDDLRDLWKTHKATTTGA